MLGVSLLTISAGDTYELETGAHEYGLLLIQGDIFVECCDERYHLGARENPFNCPPWALLSPSGERIKITSVSNSSVGLGYAPSEKKNKCCFITPQHPGGGKRGIDNWSREVRLILWNDNTEGCRLMIGETIVPPGNWSSFPPHRHQHMRPGIEAAYEEAYLFRFSRPSGFGFVGQYSDMHDMDQAFCVRENDLVYMDSGYHPVVNSPAGWMYQATFMAGDSRVSSAAVDEQYQFLLDGAKIGNPYQNQKTK